MNALPLRIDYQFKRGTTDKCIMAKIEKIVTTEGHLIDSGLMRQIFDIIISDGGKFEVLDFTIGRDNDEFSKAQLKISSDDSVTMNTILLKLSSVGCHIETDEQVMLKDALADGVVPPDFYSTTNHETQVRLNGDWVNVENIRMDGVIVVSEHKATVKKFRDVKKGEKIVCGLTGINVIPEFVERDRAIFTFMSGEVSTERQVHLAVDQVAELIRDRSKRVVVVSGPVVVHTGGNRGLASLIEHGYVHALLSGNALAVHDIEAALYDTSLGINNKTGKPVEMGHRNHLRAINEVRRAGSIANLINEGTLKSGVMYWVIKTGIPFSLAGSLRDDGPLPETITDMNKAQEDHARLLKGADIVIMLSSMLHSIAVGNMIPSRVLTICVDINPAVVTKLKDRGSMQTIGIVTDVGLFLHLLVNKLGI